MAFLTQAVNGFGAVGISLLVARNFSTTEFGDFRFFQLSVNMLAAIAAPGISVVASKYFAKSEVAAPGMMPPIAHLWVISFLFAGIIALFCVFLPFSPVVSEATMAKSLFIATAFLVAANFMPAGAMIGLSLFFKELMIQFVVMSAFVVGVLFAIWSHGLLLVFWAMLWSRAVALSVNVWVVVHKTGLNKIGQSYQAFSFRKAVVIILSRLGPMTLVGISMTATFWIVGWILRKANQDPLVFAQYSIGLQWFSLAYSVPSVVGKVTFPKVVQSIARSSDSTKQLLWFSLKAAFYSSLLVTFGAVLLLPRIMSFYGNQYADATMLIPAYAAAAIPYGLTNMIGYVVVANNDEKSWMYISLSQLLMTIVAAWIFIGTREMAGAAALISGSVGALALSTFLAIRTGLIDTKRTEPDAG